jgi:hypothetical protein
MNKFLNKQDKNVLKKHQWPVTFPVIVIQTSDKLGYLGQNWN